MKIGCCVKERDIAVAVAAGFDFVELSGAAVAAADEQSFSVLCKTVERMGTECRALNAALPPEIKICGAGFDATRAGRYAELLCQRASQLGAECIGIGSPRSRADIIGFPEELAWQQALLFMEIFCGAAAPYGINVLWESLSHGETSFGIHTDNGVRRMIEPLRSKGISNNGLVCDFYHMDHSGEDVHILFSVLPMVCHVHVAGNSVQERGFPDVGFLRAHRDCFILLQGVEGITLSIEALQGNVSLDAAGSLDAIRRFLGDVRKASRERGDQNGD